MMNKDLEILTNPFPNIPPRAQSPAETHVPDPKTGAVKADSAKLRYDLLPPEPIDELVKVLTFGAQKYADNNWQKGFNWTRTYAAAMRHLQAWRRGETLDPETDINHLAHAMCNLVFLLWFAEHEKGEDDRISPELRD